MPPHPTPATPPPRQPVPPASQPHPAPAHHVDEVRGPGRAAVAAALRIYPVAPRANADEIMIAAVREIVTTCTAPCDRVLLADPTHDPAPVARDRRDRLVETVLRLGRGATTRPACDHHPRRLDSGPSAESRSESGPGPTPRGPVGAVVNRTQATPSRRDPSPRPDQFTLIIFGCATDPVEPASLARWVPLLASTGTLVVLTHSSQQRESRSTRSGGMCRAAAAVGLDLTDRLIIAHEHPRSCPRTTRDDRRALARTGHRRAHSTALVFRASRSRGDR